MYGLHMGVQVCKEARVIRSPRVRVTVSCKHTPLVLGAKIGSFIRLVCILNLEPPSLQPQTVRFVFLSFYQCVCGGGWCLCRGRGA